jgi:hypothetical protein
MATPDYTAFEKLIGADLSSRLLSLTEKIDSTNKTLKKVSDNIIAANERQNRRQNKFQAIYLILTAFIVIAASSSAYFAYKSIKISSGQQSLQTTQVILEIVTAVKETIQDLQVTSSGHENTKKAKISPIKEQNKVDQNLGDNKETSQEGVNP